MNINEVNQTNSENTNRNKIVNTQNYANQNRADRIDDSFSYYVESGKIMNVDDNSQEDDSQENQQQDDINTVTISNELQNGTQLGYIQTFQALNTELFDLGIANEKNNFSNGFQYNINLSDLTMNDIKLFEGLTQKTDLAVNNFDVQTQTFNAVINGEGLNISYRSIDVSKTLFSALENASKTGKSVRLDFGQDTSVILKISKDGKLSADFIPNEKAMEAILKNALPQLKAKFDEENLPYNELNYKNFNQQKNNQKGNKENKDE